jgi:hypothetical protein
MGTVNNVAVATTSTAVASSVFGSTTYQVRIAATAACSYLVGLAPTAVATSVLLPPNWVEYVRVSPSEKISVFSATIQTVSVVEVAE